MLQQTATEEAMASTATSLRNSSLEGKKLCGGSFIDFSNEIDDIEEEDEGRRWRPLRVEEKGNEGGKGKGKCDFEAVRSFGFLSLELQENKIK